MSAGPKNALFMTVGSEINNNGSLSDALLRSVDAQVFDRLVLLASPQSVEGARKLAGRVGWDEEAVHIQTLRSAHDLDEVFRTVNAEINRLISHGYAAERITINYTSGTKVMSSGAVLSAIYNSCESLQYITGAGAGGRAQQTLQTRPRSIYAYQDLMRARNDLLRRQFGSAEELLTEYDRTLSHNLLHLVLAYAAWENSHLERFAQNYDAVSFEQGELAEFALEEGQRQAIERLAEDFAQRRPSPLLCVAMRNGAWRILHAGDADDATERLYRALEFLAQWKLAHEYNTHTDDLDIRKVPPKYRAMYETMRSMDDGRIRIGMRKSYELLALMDDATGTDFAARADLQAALKTRDGSLLGHGVTPVALPDAWAFMRSATEFFRTHIEDFDILCHALQFPWLKELNTGEMAMTN